MSAERLRMVDDNGLVMELGPDHASVIFGFISHVESKITAEFVANKRPDDYLCQISSLRPLPIDQSNYWTFHIDPAAAPDRESLGNTVLKLISERYQIT